MSKPADTIRDGRLKATIWRNSTEKGDFYSVDLVRGYKDRDGQWQDATNFNSSDLLRIANLATLAHNRIVQLKATGNGNDDD